MGWGYGMGSPTRPYAPQHLLQTCHKSCCLRRDNKHITPGPFPALPTPRLVLELKYFN